MSNIDAITKILQASSSHQQFSSHSTAWIARMFAVPRPQTSLTVLDHILQSFRASRKVNTHEQILRSIVKQNYIQAAFSKFPGFQYQSRVSGTLNEAVRTYYGTLLQATKAAGTLEPQQEKEVLQQLEEKTVAVLDPVIANKYATQEDIQLMQDRLVAYVDQIIHDTPDKRKRKRWSHFKNHMIATLISLFFWLIPSPTSDAVTQKDLEDAVEAVKQHFDRLSTANKLLRKVVKPFKLREGPAFRYKRKAQVRKDDFVELVDSDENWVKVRFVDREGYPSEGWIPKAYLRTVHGQHF